MDWLKHAVVFRIPLGDMPSFAQAYIEEDVTSDDRAVWVVVKGRNKMRLKTDGSEWLEHPARMLKLDVTERKKLDPFMVKEQLETYRRQTYFETKEHALEIYVAWRRSQGAVSYAPGLGS